MESASFARAAASVVLGCAIACSGSEPVPADGVDTSTLGSATRTLLARLLERRQACYGASPGCVAWKTRAGEPRAAALDAALASGRISYDRAQADLCAAWLNAATCPEIEESYTELDPSCDAYVVGLVTTAGECNASAECADGYCTADVPTGTCPGTCVPFVADGDACVDRLQCASRACNGATCVADAPGAENGACGFGPIACQGGLYCGAGTCRPRLAEGADCDSNRSACQTGLGCADRTRLCRPWGGPGESCLYSLSCRADECRLVACAAGYQCDGQTCITLPYLGGFCEVNTQTLLITMCQDDSYCDRMITHTCVAGTVPLGEVCSDMTASFCADGGHCSVWGGPGTCVADAVDACY